MPIEIIKWKRNGMYTFRVKAPNGQIIAESEYYTSSDAAKRGMHSLCKIVGDIKFEDLQKIEIQDSI